jgi:hypothetical protein
MPHPRRLRLAFVVLHLALGVALLVASVLTAARASGAHHGQPTNVHLLVLGGVEALFAAAFLLPPTCRLGAAGLVAVCAYAALLHLARGEFRGDLLVYAAGAAFVGLHGPAYRSGEPRLDA